jgi:hypothetical protein
LNDVLVRIALPRGRAILSETFLCSRNLWCTLSADDKKVYLFVPRKNRAIVPGPEWAPITGST